MRNSVEAYRTGHYALVPLLDSRGTPGPYTDNATYFSMLVAPPYPVVKTLPSSLSFYSVVVAETFNPRSVVAADDLYWLGEFPSRTDLDPQPPRSEENEALGPLLDLKRAMKDRVVAQLHAAREEAEHEGLPSLTQAAEEACEVLAAKLIERFFWRRTIKLAATAKLNGGATLVIADKVTGRRIDFEFAPDAGSLTVYSMDGGGRVSRARYDQNASGLDQWLVWLLRHAQSSP